MMPVAPTTLAAQGAPQRPAMAPEVMLPRAKAYIARERRPITLPRYSD
jgi:hypothetical protein